MKFRTEINITPSELKLGYNDLILTLGSCFAENISVKLKEGRFPVIENPFGVLYNPASIYNSLGMVKNRQTFTEDDLIENQEEYHSFRHHSDFSSHDRNEVFANINSVNQYLSGALPKVSIAFISLGTSTVYKHIKQDFIVSNCHKIPANEFTRFRLTVDETADYLKKTIDILCSFNPAMNIIFTVSPVRHMRDGAVANNINKAVLILAIDKVKNELANVGYFPSYEILLDDLRDYRFYNSDLVHPSDQAVEYIWEKFMDNYFNEETKTLYSQMIKISNARKHRIRNKNSVQTRKFAKANIELIEKITSANPHISLHDDMNYFQDLLK